MDPRRQQKLQALSKFNMFQSLKKTLPALLSILLLSFICSSFSSSWISISFNSLHICFSTVMFNFFNYYISRQLLFLLCNGILVFVTGGAGLIRSSPSTTANFHDKFYGKNGDQQQSKPDFVEMKVMKATCGDKEGKMGNDGSLVHIIMKEELEYDNINDDDDNDRDENEVLVESSGPLVCVNMREEQDFDDVNIEESDERFDDFIKKMKEHMRIEALQLLPMFGDGYYHNNRR